MNNNNRNNDNSAEAKKKRKTEAQKIHRARSKHDYELIQANPEGSYTNKQRKNHARYVKFLNSNRRYNQKRKEKAENDPAEKILQRENNRKYSYNYRDRKKSRQSTETCELDVSHSTNDQIESSESTVRHNYEYPNELVIPQQNESSTTESTVVETRTNFLTSFTTPIQAALINNNAIDMSTNDVNLTCSSARVMLQSSPTKSPRNNTIDESLDNTTSEFITEEPMTQFDFNNLNDTEMSMLRCLENDLFSWGFPEKDRLTTHILHSALQIVQKPDVGRVKEQNPVTLKDDFVDSFKMLLDVEVQGAKNSYTVVVDEIENLAKERREILYGRPYSLVDDTNGKKTSRMLKNTFRDTSYEKYLDPRKRFSLRTQSKNKNLLQSFTQNHNCLDGYVFELMIAQFVQEKKVQCRSCMKPTLRWNGGSGYPWMDLVCISCKSTYEIKSKNCLDKASEDLRNGLIEGGCFPSFQNIRSCYREQDQAKQYVIIVSRTPRGRSYPSYSSICAEIKNVYPIINTKSFANMDKLKFKSKIIITRIYGFVSINKDSYSPGKNQSFAGIAKSYLEQRHGLV